MRRRGFWLAALALALCGCNQDAPVASAPPPPPQQAAPPIDVTSLPPNEPCTDLITRYQTILDSDHRTGNVGDSVFAQIEHELTDAAAACSAGQNGQAMALVHASEDKHGYHV